MALIVQIIGVVFMLIGILLLIKPKALNPLMQFIKKGKRIYLAALTRITLAVIFLLAAGDCHVKEVIAVFGILFLLSGLMILMLGPKMLSGIIELIQKRSPLFLRVLAAVVLAIGVIIAYSANPAS